MSMMMNQEDINIPSTHENWKDLLPIRTVHTSMRNQSKEWESEGMKGKPMKKSISFRWRWGSSVAACGLHLCVLAHAARGYRLKEGGAPSWQRNRRDRGSFRAWFLLPEIDSRHRRSIPVAEDRFASRELAVGIHLRRRGAFLYRPRLLLALPAAHPRQWWRRIGTGG